MSTDIISTSSSSFSTTSSPHAAADASSSSSKPSFSAYSVDDTVNDIISYLRKAGTEAYLGPQEESVTQLSHSLQAAEQARIARQAIKQHAQQYESKSMSRRTAEEEAVAQEEEEEIILAALLHDIGHMILAKPDAWGHQSSPNEQHEHVGYHYLLEHGFSSRIAELVLGHVEAKRYLCWKEPTYHSTLSEASKMTLIGQGGPMTEEEARKFEASPLMQTKLAMRRWDEAAKEKNWPITGNELQTFGDMIRRHLEKQRALALQS